MKYDFLIVGAGLFGAVAAQMLNESGYKVLVIDSREEVGGNCQTIMHRGIMMHKYGAHIFHTSNEKVWQYVNRFAKFNNFINSPLANYKGELYNLPFNMNTFYQFYKTTTPKEAMKAINRAREKYPEAEITNLEDQAISLVGKDIYEKLIKGYTEKQWGKSCDHLPPDIIKRLPLRFMFNNNYFNDTYQGIPIEGYSKMITNMLQGVTVLCGVDYKNLNTLYPEVIYDKVIYTGSIDECFNYCYGELEYRSLRFEHEELAISNFQGNAVVNYTDKETPYTRIIEHKHFSFGTQPETIITYEYPDKWELGKERYYPINNEKNNFLYQKYIKLSKQYPNLYFGGRLGLYKYLDMDKTIEAAFKLIDELIDSSVKNV